jgi:hypothetical protein
MVALLRRNLAQQAPTGSVSVDWGHTLARALMLCVVDSVAPGADLAGGRHMVNGTWSGVESPWGRAVQASGTMHNTPSMLAFSSNQLTVAAAYTYFTAPVTNEAWLLNADSAATLGADARQFQLRITTGGSLNFIPFLEVGNGNLLESSTPAGKHVAIGVATRSRQELWRNGVVRASATNTNGSAITQTRVGRGSTGTNQPLLSSGWVWNRALTQDECRWFSAEPFAMLTQAPIRSTFLLGSTAAPFRPQVIAA